eukprot:4940834-Pleurochrysis_carterae.AAC.1
MSDRLPASISAQLHTKPDLAFGDMAIAILFSNVRIDATGLLGKMRGQHYISDLCDFSARENPYGY